MSVQSPEKGPLDVRVAAWLRRPESRWILLIWVVLTVALGFFAVVPARIMGTPMSTSKYVVEETMTVFTLVAAPVAAMVWAIAIYSVLKWRHRGEGPPTEDGPALRSNRAVTATWLFVSSALVLFLLIWGLGELQASAAPSQSSNALEVDVTGQQWVWTFTYPQDGNVTSTNLYLPVNRPVVFRVASKDVVHSFWAVELGVKIDANPGYVTETSTEPTRLGTFNVRCAELCGLYHADMETTGQVVSGGSFAQWITAQGGQVR